MMEINLLLENLKDHHLLLKNSVYSKELFIDYSKINNWIQWSPNGSIWVPQNIKEVRSYGAEVNFKYHFKIKKIQLKLKTGIAYTRTTVINSDIDDDPAIGNQATYVPFVNANSSLFLVWKRFVFRYQALYKGKQFTSLDNKERSALASYYMNNLSIWRNSKIKSYSMSINGEKPYLDTNEYKLNTSKFYSK